MDCNMEEVKGQKACFAARAQCVPWAKMAAVPAVLDSVPSQVTFCQVQFQRWRGLHPMKKGRKKHRGSKQAGDKHV